MNRPDAVEAAWAAMIEAFPPQQVTANGNDGGVDLPLIEAIL
jgi:hypothetical protein